MNSNWYAVQDAGRVVALAERRGHQAATSELESVSGPRRPDHVAKSLPSPARRTPTRPCLTASLAEFRKHFGTCTWPPRAQMGWIQVVGHVPSA